jgi:hypothetical protein
VKVVELVRADGLQWVLSNLTVGKFVYEERRCGLCSLDIRLVVSVAELGCGRWGGRIAVAAGRWHGYPGLIWLVVHSHDTVQEISIW